MATLVRWEPFREIATRQNEMSRLMNTFSGVGAGNGETSLKADYHDGVLEVRVAKPEQSKPRRIRIGSGEQKMIDGKATKA